MVERSRKRIRYYTSSHHLGGFARGMAAPDDSNNLMMHMQEVVPEADNPEREQSPLKRFHKKNTNSIENLRIEHIDTDQEAREEQSVSGRVTEVSKSERNKTSKKRLNAAKVDAKLSERGRNLVQNSDFMLHP